MKMLQHRFVNNIPEHIEDGILYISMEYSTAIHKCVCGCGNEVVTPFSPTDWRLTFDGKTVSLHPSIGNWNFDCQTHYWIVNNKILYAGKWSKEEVKKGRKKDKKLKHRYYKGDLHNPTSSVKRRKSKKRKGLKSIFSTLFNL